MKHLDEVEHTNMGSLRPNRGPAVF